MAFSPEKTFEYLRRAHGQNRLAHAYLISGAPGSGKRRLATRLCDLLNQTGSEDVSASNASGIFLTEPESKSRRIVIEQIRDLEHSLQLRAAPGRHKIAIISEADRLQPQAANAFLKTLEEPPKDSLLLLLSAIPEALPDTIRSRCIAIPLASEESVAPAREETELIELLCEVAREKNRDVQTAYRMVRGFQRLLGNIREAIQSENAAAEKRDEVHYKNTTDGRWLEEREDYYKALTESLYLERRARLIETLFLWWSDVLRAKTRIEERDLSSAKNETRSLGQELSTPEILRRIRRLEELRDHLGRNIQETLALEVAFLQIFGP